MSCRNHFTEIQTQSLIILREPIVILNITSTAVAFPTGAAARFNITLAKGSHVTYTVDFGDGSIENVTSPVRLSSMAPIIVEHVYAAHANYTVSVLASNEHFSDSAVMAQTIPIQNPVGGITLVGPPAIKPAIQATFSLMLEGSARRKRAVPMTPDNVFCAWLFTNQEPQVFYDEALVVDGISLKTFTFTATDIQPLSTLNVTCYNLASSIDLYHEFYIQEEVSDVAASVSALYIETDANLTVYITTLSGSHVSCSVDYQDGNTNGIAFSTLFAKDSSLVFHHAYSLPGEFTLNITCANLISSVQPISVFTIIVQNIISNLQVVSSPTLPSISLWPPGTITFTLVSLPGQQMLTNITCTFTFDDQLAYSDTVPLLDVGASATISVNVSKDFIGNNNITSRCSNLVSHNVIMMNVEVQLDQVILENLVVNETLYWSNITVVDINVLRFGTRSCFDIDMGDGQSHYVYGLPSCLTYAEEHKYIFSEIPFETMRITHDYNYTSIGTYYIYIFAFNHVSNSSLSGSTVVMDWPCEFPQIIIGTEYTNPSAPKTIKKSKSIGIFPRFEINCTSTDAYKTYWVITSGGSTVVSLYDVDSLELEPKYLEYGSYTVNLTVAMYSTRPVLKVDQKKTIVIMYIEIIPSPLRVKITHGEEYGRKYNALHTIEALDLTYDPDMDDPDDQTGMSFKLFCRREDEQFIQDTNGHVTQTPFVPAPGAVRDASLGFGGCFKEGPGFIFDGGSYLFNTSDMIGMTEYVFRFEVFKDTRWGYAEQYFYVGPEDPPETNAV